MMRFLSAVTTGCLAAMVSLVDPAATLLTGNVTVNSDDGLRPGAYTLNLVRSEGDNPHDALASTPITLR